MDDIMHAAILAKLVSEKLPILYFVECRVQMFLIIVG